MSVSKRERLFTLAGLVVESVALDGDSIRVTARSSAASASCPCCGRASQRVHSRYQRRLADLPAHGRRVEMTITARRFRCPHADCTRRIFAERLDLGATTAHGRRTSRLDGVVHHLGVALSARWSGRGDRIAPGESTWVCDIHGQLVLDDRACVRIKLLISALSSNSRCGRGDSLCTPHWTEKGMDAEFHS